MYFHRKIASVRLIRFTKTLPSSYRLPCVALAHNEELILPEFLTHYRQLGVDHFFIVDDRSNDNSSDILASQPDVTIFIPVEGSSYARDKRYWRAELLDRFADGRWAVVPDIDEHLVFRDCENSSLHELIIELEREGAEAFHATMVDMYRDEPLVQHIHDRSTLLESFPLFDGPDYYFRVAAPHVFRRRFPVPHCMVVGGPLQRLFEPLPLQPESRKYARLRRSCDISGPLSGGRAFQFSAALTRLRLRRALSSVMLYNVGKLPLVKWRRGMKFSGGAHAVSAPITLSSRTGALLHFKFAAGMAGVQYIAERGQHVGESKYYKRILSQGEITSRSPIFRGSLHFQDSASLGRILD